MTSPPRTPSWSPWPAPPAPGPARPRAPPSATATGAPTPRATVDLPSLQLSALAGLRRDGRRLRVARRWRPRCCSPRPASRRGRRPGRADATSPVTASSSTSATPGAPFRRPSEAHDDLHRLSRRRLRHRAQRRHGAVRRGARGGSRGRPAGFAAAVSQRAGGPVADGRLTVRRAFEETLVDLGVPTDDGVVDRMLAAGPRATCGSGGAPRGHRSRSSSRCGPRVCRPPSSATVPTTPGHCSSGSG